VETAEDLDQVDREMRYRHGLNSDDQVYFLELDRGDASEFEDTLRVTGERIGRHAVLRARSPVVANSIAALLIELEKSTGKLPHGYFQWTEGNPVGNLLRFLFLGEGDVAPITHEVLRRAIPDPLHRPFIIVGLPRHLLEEQLQCEERGVTFVHVITSLVVETQRAQHPQATDSEHHLLAQPVTLIAAVKINRSGRGRKGHFRADWCPAGIPGR
jgi:hypothetical protein